ncbi:MAG: FAD-dependent oxidoreductase [Kiritimatiellae bacterium]|nr:FAD-dependent oxidoreductase [Kiritimatiellia bacterium]
MSRVRFLILGAGPTGLALAHSLLQRGVPRRDVLVIESEAVSGGLCRSAMVDGRPIDIGGGHFLDVRKQEVLDLLFHFMPASEWDIYRRVAKINLSGQEIDHPLESNLWQLSKQNQADYLESIARAGCVAGSPMPESFEEWVRWRLGERIAQDYMLPYNRKIWSMALDRLGTYWLHKLPDVSFRDALRSCLEGKPYGTLPAHGSFMYPKTHGYGEVWRRMGVALGDRLITGCQVNHIDVTRRTVNGRFTADTVISTIPWSEWPRMADIPDEIADRMAELVHVGIDVDYCSDNLSSRAHWIYEPCEQVPHHRILVRHNFCPGSRGYWTETNALRSGPAGIFRHRNEFAYPVNTRGKPEAVSAILAWAATQRIIGAGRWGKWEHMNSDVAVAESIRLAGDLVENKDGLP